MGNDIALFGEYGPEDAEIMHIWFNHILGSVHELPVPSKHPPDHLFIVRFKEGDRVGWVIENEEYIGCEEYVRYGLVGGRWLRTESLLDWPRGHTDRWLYETPILAYRALNAYARSKQPHTETCGICRHWGVSRCCHVGCQFMCLHHMLKKGKT